MAITARAWQVVRRPVRDAGRNAAFLATGVLIQLAALLLLATPWIYFVPAAPWAITCAVFLPVAVIVAAVPVLTWAQRVRFRARLGVELPEAPAGARRRPAVRELPGWLRSPPGRRQLRYHLLAGPSLSFGAVVALLMWAAGLAAGSVYAWMWLLPVDWRLDHLGYATGAAYVTAGGIVAAGSAGWLSAWLVRVDTRCATGLLGPSREEQLARRVQDLTRSRAEVLDATDAERRRIERDLHDGAQQRLVSLAVNLGLAKATLTDLPDDARRVIEEAHREAKEAIAELNDLVRGLHPAVLEDRGLDAALSGIAARAPLPVRLRVDVASRPSPTVEAVAYFVVSEALANVVKHARASRAEVTVERAGPVLSVVIRDDGVGGADPRAGSGLAGLAGRVAAVDGTMSVSSPAGGPTVVRVELPCAL